MLMPKSRRLAKLLMAITVVALALSIGMAFAPLAQASLCYVECVGCPPCSPNEAKCTCFSGGYQWSYCSWLGNNPICAD